MLCLLNDAYTLWLFCMLIFLVPKEGFTLLFYENAIKMKLWLLIRSFKYFCSYLVIVCELHVWITWMVTKNVNKWFLRCRGSVSVEFKCLTWDLHYTLILFHVLLGTLLNKVGLSSFSAFYKDSCHYCLKPFSNYTTA